MYSLPASTTLAALTMASAASIEPISPLVSTIPSASSDILLGPSAGRGWASGQPESSITNRQTAADLNEAKANILQYRRQLRYDARSKPTARPQYSCPDLPVFSCTPLPRHFC